MVTADRELSNRCRAAARASGRKLQMVPPASLLADLERVAHETHDQGDGVAPEPMPLSGLAAEVEAEIEAEIMLGASLREAEVRLRRKRYSPRKRSKLSKQLHRLQQSLNERTGGSIGAPTQLERLTAVLEGDANEGDSEGIGALAREAQDAVMARWEYRRRIGGRREQTGDRVILAERMRRTIEAAVGPFGVGAKVLTPADTAALSPAEAHAKYINDMCSGLTTGATFLPRGAPTVVSGASGASTEPATRLRSDHAPSPPVARPPLRLVVVSDTHGFESSLGSDASLVAWDPVATLEAGNARHATDPQCSPQALPLAPDAWRDMATVGGEPDGVVGAQPGTVGAACTRVPLPEGDVLLHLGDFAIDGPSRPRIAALLKFDEWLAEQPHPVKIVLRGNHDPWEVHFPRSNATYVTKPRSLSVGGWTLALVPYHGRATRVKIPEGELLATHVPPKALLDKTYNGDRAGSSALRGAVERRDGGPPAVWLCGHIHEGRGCERAHFGGRGQGEHETLVINAANANSGRANRLIAGPVLVTLVGESVEAVTSPLVKAEAPEVAATELLGIQDASWASMYEPHESRRSRRRRRTQSPAVSASGAVAVAPVVLATTSGGPEEMTNEVAFVGRVSHMPNIQDAAADTPSAARPSTREMVLAVDLGLRTGLCLLDDAGRLIRYEQMVFVDEEELAQAAARILEEWESDANHEGAQHEQWTITNLAIEGGDPLLWAAWRAAAEGGAARGVPAPRILSITADEWRSHLLLPKEKKSGSEAKAAARLIARQVVADFGTMAEHTGSFATDSAESVLLGFYVACRLGWISRQPPIRRYSNGRVVLPKKVATGDAREAH